MVVEGRVEDRVEDRVEGWIYPPHLLDSLNVL